MLIIRARVPLRLDLAGGGTDVFPEDIFTAGDKKIEIKSIETGEVIPVGTCKVTS